MAGLGSRSQANGSEDEQRGTTMWITAATTTTTIGGHCDWEVQYARFFNTPSPSSASGHRHPSLVPLPDRRSKGSWITSSKSLAHLKLLNTNTDDSNSVILTVTLANNLIEEHYISKLLFTWPQVSCLSGFPPRGSRILFSSYKDHTGQIQKFAVRFLTIHEAERFINALKENFGDERHHGSTSGICSPRPSSQSEIFPSPEPANRGTKDRTERISSDENSQPMYRPTKDWSPITSSAETSAQQTHPSGNYEACQNSNPLETTPTQNVTETLSAFPPSFTSLLMNCCPAREQDLPTVSEEVNLKMEITKCLEDSSFQDMLSKIQKVISEFGDDLLL